jgi:2'-5' RNA ligase
MPDPIRMFLFCSIYGADSLSSFLMIASFAYLFMLLPPLPVRDRIAAGDWVGPMRSPIASRRLHLTLAEIADLPQRCPHMVDIMRAVLADHQLRACAFALARLVVKPEIAMLEPVGRRSELVRLRSELTTLLIDAGLPNCWAKTFNPHVTVGRGDFRPGRRPIGPIFWSADQIALVESWRGETHYEILEIWPLLPPRQGSFEFDCAA